jgi:hypothetical protein
MTITTEKIITPNPADPSVTQTKTFKSRLNGSTLLISEVRTDENNQEIEVLIMEQPWKCNPDGSREHFANEEDAATWLELVKDSLL